MVEKFRVDKATSHQCPVTGLQPKASPREPAGQSQGPQLLSWRRSQSSEWIKLWTHRWGAALPGEAAGCTPGPGSAMELILCSSEVCSALCHWGAGPSPAWSAGAGPWAKKCQYPQLWSVCLPYLTLHTSHSQWFVLSSSFRSSATCPSSPPSGPHLFPSSSDCSEETSVGIWEAFGCCPDEPIEKPVRKWIILYLMKGL